MPPRVLVLDNDHSLRRLLELALRQAGFTVALAAHAEQATAILGAGGVAALVVDLNLGGGRSGLQLVQEWSARRMLPPFLVVTGTPDDLRVEEMARLPEYRGAIGKPFLVSDLVAQVRRFAPAAATPPPAPVQEGGS